MRQGDNPVSSGVGDKFHLYVFVESNSLRLEFKTSSLQSHSRSETDLFNKSGTALRNTLQISKFSYIEEILNSFQCELESVRLLRLSPGNFIYEHCKHDYQYEDGFLRLHIPIQTNPKVSHRINDRLIFMKPGECWYVDVNAPHSVSNNGTTDRIHLVIDARRNEWTDALFQEMQKTSEPVAKARKKKKILEYVFVR
jgi:hypothetical protein